MKLIKNNSSVRLTSLAKFISVKAILLFLVTLLAFTFSTNFLNNSFAAESISEKDIKEVNEVNEKNELIQISKKNETNEISKKTETKPDLSKLKIKKIDGTFATQKELKRQQELVNKLNKPSDIKYENRLTNDEWKERLKFLQNLEKYSLKWYYDFMRTPDDEDECNSDNHIINSRCHSILLLVKLNSDQVASIFINYDKGFLFDNSDNPITHNICNTTLENLIVDVLDNGMDLYVYAKDFSDRKIVINKTSVIEITSLLKNKLILTKFGSKFARKCSQLKFNNINQ